MDTDMTTDASSPLRSTSFQGWAWRGAHLQVAEFAAYRPGEQVKHLGCARARLDEEQDFPFLLRVYAHQAQPDPVEGEVVFPENGIFQVLGVQTLSEKRTCLWLEQVVPNVEPGGDDVTTGLHAWLARMAGPLPEVNPDLEEAWRAPFARWAPEAQTGDEPLRGIFYEFEEAVRFVCACTGMEEIVVRSVLDAAGRYLELAGTAQGEQDEELLRERDALRHLLPEDPRVLEPELQMAYLFLNTGLEEDLIDRVLNGETEYLRSLGLVVDDEEEDDLDTGFAPWRALFPDLMNDLRRHLAEETDIADLRFAGPSPDPAWALVSATALPQGGHLETLRVEGISSGSQELLSFFPVARDGAEHALKIRNIDRCGNDREAMVAATTATGCDLTFYHVDHLHPWNALEEGYEAPVFLAGFALELTPAPCPSPRLILEDFEESAFQGRVSSVDLLSAWGGPIYRLELAGQDGFMLPVYATPQVMPEGYRPRPGDEIQGILWLQGASASGTRARPIYNLKAEREE